MPRGARCYGPTLPETPILRSATARFIPAYNTPVVGRNKRSVSGGMGRGIQASANIDKKIGETL
jgi:hypothetical protein